MMAINATMTGNRTVTVNRTMTEIRIVILNRVMRKRKMTINRIMKQQDNSKQEEDGE
jgi:hypothetical protein